MRRPPLSCEIASAGSAPTPACAIAHTASWRSLLLRHLRLSRSAPGVAALLGLPGCRVTPIAVGLVAPQAWPMVPLTIRCHPRVPISPDELEGWLELEVKDLRAQAPRATVRLSRLTQGRADTHLDIGWLIELELDPSEPLLVGDRLSLALRDMRLLGLQPTLLAPTPPTTHTNGQAE